MSLRAQFANYAVEQPNRPQRWADVFLTNQVEQPVRLRVRLKPDGVTQYAGMERLIRDVPKNELSKALDEVYVFKDRAAVEAFLEENHLRGHLLRAVGPLNRSFGQTAIKVLTLVRDDEGFENLFCLVLMPGDPQRAKEALRAFDQEWWLRNAPKALGRLNFDFELV